MIKLYVLIWENIHFRLGSANLLENLQEVAEFNSSKRYQNIWVKMITILDIIIINFNLH